MIGALILALKSGLSLWESKESRKYSDEVIELEKRYYVEYNKERPDHAVLDNIGFELRNISKGFSSQVRQKDSLDRR